MARALGRAPEDSFLENTWQLSRHTRGSVGLLFTNRSPSDVLAYFADELSERPRVDFARCGATAPRAFAIPWGPVYSTAGEVPPEHDVPLGHALEPELRRLGVPTRMVRGRVVLEPPPGGAVGDDEAGFVVCREGDTLDARQARLLKLFGVCLAEFRVAVRAYWSAATGEVTVVDDSGEGAGMDEDDEASG